MRKKRHEPMVLGDFVKRYSENPGASFERTKDDEERWVAARVFRDIVGSSATEQVWITHREKPDFLVEKDRVRIGLEITEGIDSSTAEKRNFLDRQDSKIGRSIVRSMDDFHPGRNDEGWTDEDYFELVDRVILTRTREKAGKAAEYEQFDALWLVIYENLHAPDPSEEHIVEHLQTMITAEFKRSFNCAIYLTDREKFFLWGDGAPIFA